MKNTRTRATAQDPRAITHALTTLLRDLPGSDEPPSAQPAVRAREIGRTAALKAAGLSSALALPPGPLGFATILPDLVMVWKIQQSMVADIGAVYGKQASLTRESLWYCLFKHGAAAIARDLLARAGERLLIRRMSAGAMQELLARTGIHVTQRVLTRSFSRVLPILGSLGVGAYAYYDTSRVAATAIELFSEDVAPEPSPSEPPEEGACKRATVA